MRHLIFSMLVVVLCLSGCSSTDVPQTEVATILSEPQAIPRFTLSRGPQQPFSNPDLDGHWSLFFFGYTRCPDVCPTELFTLAETLRRMEERPELVSSVPQVVFVSVDPQQDQPQAVQQYTGYYHPKFFGMTGEQAVVDELAASMGAVYERVYYHDGKELAVDPQQGPPPGLENAYLINHSATLFLLNPNGALHAVFSTPHIPEKIIQDLNAIQQAWD